MINMLELPPPIYFSFTDPFIQEYYKYSLNEIEYFLKLSLLLGSHVEITAANLWQSPLSIELFKSAFPLFGNKKDVEQPLIRLATREFARDSEVFSTYFSQRLEEKEHFVVLPDVLTYLDFQLPETLKVAKYLDNNVRAYSRRGGNVTELYSKFILERFSCNQSGMFYDKLLLYNHLKSISRATVADCILSTPLLSRRQEELVLDSNEIYFRANALATQSQLIYPLFKYQLLVYKPDEFCFEKRYLIESNDRLSEIMKSINLSREVINSISFRSFDIAHKCGVLDFIKRYIWFLRNQKTNNFNLINSFLKLLARKTINQLIDINKGNSFFNDVDFFEIDAIKNGITPKRIFHFKLNRALFFGGVERMQEQKINVATLIEECNSKLNIDELKTIAVEIFGDYEFLSHSNRLELVRELCLACNKKGKLEELVTRCMKYNPNFTILSLNIVMPGNIVDWRGGGGVGEQISTENQEKIIGASHRFQSIAFLQKGFELSKRICMLVNNDPSQGFRASCFLVNREYLITNRHVIKNKDIAKNTEIWFNYEEGTSRQCTQYKLHGQEAVISDKYDIALCRINYDSEPDFLDTFPEVHFGRPHLDDIVPIIQHPNGWPKQICIGHNSLQYINAVRIQYVTDTMPGSSGAPVFDSSWNLIGLHSCGGLILEPRTGHTVFRNEGIHIDVIREFLEENGVELI